jgi:hypothetical protein
VSQLSHPAVLLAASICANPHCESTFVKLYGAIRWKVARVARQYHASEADCMWAVWDSARKPLPPEKPLYRLLSRVQNRLEYLLKRECTYQDNLVGYCQAGRVATYTQPTGEGYVDTARALQSLRPHYQARLIGPDCKQRRRAKTLFRCFMEGRGLRRGLTLKQASRAEKQRRGAR